MGVLSGFGPFNTLIFLASPGDSLGAIQIARLPAALLCYTFSAYGLIRCGFWKRRKNMHMHSKFWLGFIGTIAGMLIVAACSARIPTPAATMPPSPTAPPSPLPSATLSSATLPPVMLPALPLATPTLATLATASTQPAAGQQALPGLAGKWIDPDSNGGGTVSTIVWQDGTYVVTSVINSSRGVNEVTKSSWANGVLTWVYCPATWYCLSQSTASLNGDALTVNWSRTDVQSTGTSVLQRQP